MSLLTGITKARRRPTKRQVKHASGQVNNNNNNKYLIQSCIFISIAFYGLAGQFARASADADHNEHLKNLAEAQRQLVQSLLVASNSSAPTNANATGDHQNEVLLGGGGAFRPQLEPSLAESTAVGTAAGLMVHDLMGQANGLHLMGSVGDDNDDDDRPPIGMEGNDEDEQETRPLEEAPSPGQQMFVDEQGHLLRQPSVDVVQQHYQQQQQQDHEQEPPGEELAPDSMDSLMRAEGESLEATDEPEEAPVAPLATGTNLINQQQQVALPVGQLPDEGQKTEEEDDDDAGDEGLEGQLRREMGQLESRESRPSGALKVPTTTADDQLQVASSAAQYQPELAHLMDGQLMAPIRDSAQDLNAAAGHYYGKKKKKKKKMIIVKKKKKKKKKVYKKVKIIKVKKVKKKKKKKKKGKKIYYGHPKMKKKKMGHHHDHGKYYMYAKVPKKKSWEFGFKKGNKKHWIERHEKGHKNKFKTKVKWFDKKSKGKGVHIWDYNHHDKKKKKKHY